MRVIRLALAVCLMLSAELCSLNTPIYASGPGTTTGELLKIPVGTRAIGMGEAFTALADDSSALYWNPAGLSNLSQKEASFMHSTLLESIHYEHMAFAAPGDTYALGGSFSYLGYGDIAGYDNSGAPTGNLSAYSYIATAGLAHSFTPELSLGVTGSLLREVLDADSAGAFDANAGALYRLPQHPWSGAYALGASVQNVGPGLKFVSVRDPLPRKYKFGAAATGVGKLPAAFTADVTLPNDNDAYLSLGSEYNLFQDMFALRIGYIGSNDQGKGLRLGFGLKYSNLLFDYAYGGFGDFGATHRISLALRFGERTKQLNKIERSILKEAKAAEHEGDYLQSIMEYNRMLEMDPANEAVLHRMVTNYDRLSRISEEEAAKAKAAMTAPVIQAMPAGERAALNALLPSSTYGQKPAPGAMAAPLKTSSGFNPEDPLGLENLPDPSNPDSVAAYLARSHETGAIPEPTALMTPAVAPAVVPSPIPPASPSPQPRQDFRRVAGRLETSPLKGEGSTENFPRPTGGEGGVRGPVSPQAASSNGANADPNTTPALSPADIFGN